MHELTHFILYNTALKHFPDNSSTWNLVTVRKRKKLYVHKQAELHFWTILCYFLFSWAQWPLRWTLKKQRGAPAALQNLKYKIVEVTVKVSGLLSLEETRLVFYNYIIKLCTSGGQSKHLTEKIIVLCLSHDVTHKHSPWRISPVLITHHTLPGTQ